MSPLASARCRRRARVESRRRRFRRKEHGVSDIVASILLVAIGVVLAAVMYVLILGVTHGPSSAPLGAHFTWGTPVNSSSMSGPVPGCGATGTAHAFCYAIEIASSDVSASNVVLSLSSATGSTVAWPVAVPVGTATDPTTSQISLVIPTVATPVSGYSTGSASWTNAAGFSGSIPGGATLVIYLVGTATVNAGLAGDKIVAVGANGYSDSVSAGAFA